MLRRVVIGAGRGVPRGWRGLRPEDAVPEESAEDSECAQQLTTAQEIVQDKVDANA